MALVLGEIGNFGCEVGMVFYNAMLPGLAPKGRMGRLSGLGWGLGYAGGLVCLALALVALVEAEVPVFGLDKDEAEHLRATGPLVAVWIAVFAVPFFLWTPDRKGPLSPGGGSALEAVRLGIRTLIETLRRVR